MSDQTAPEPTMEEILASIRRIISEDDAPEGEGAVAAQADDEFEPEAIETADEGAAAPEETAAPEPEVFQPEPEPARAEAPAARQEPLVSREAASAAANAFGQLSAAVTQPSRNSPTLEDLAREMLAPMLRQWLDKNLPAIVQAAVRDEVERISRGRVG
jgi:cell pole-organizing protein PopZ